MLVRDIMRSPVVTIPPDTSLSAAYEAMRARHIRHLPVVEEGRLVGIVTDRDLRLATSSLSPWPFPPDARVENVMRRRPLTADPMDPVEEAARTMREEMVGCLPVVREDALVGIITGPDLLDALMRMTGIGSATGRLELKLANRPGDLARLAGRIAERGLSIRSVLSYPDGPDATRTVLRIGSIETRALAGDLREAGFDVLWPPERP